MARQPSPTERQDARAAVPAAPSTGRLWVVRVLTAMAILAALGGALCLRDSVQELKRYGYVAVFLVGLISNATLILPVPGLAVTSLMGGVFNPWIVGLIGGVGQALGELTGYMAGYSGQSWIHEHAAYERLTRRMQRYGALAIFLLAVIPNPIFDVGGMAAGALRFPLWKFLVSCTAGKVAKNVIFALLGYYGTGAVLRLIGWPYP